MFEKLISEDRAVIANWSGAEPVGQGVLRVVGAGLLVAVVLVLGVFGGSTGARLSEELPGSLGRKIRRVRRGQGVTALLWRREGGAGAPTGPSVAQVHSDLSCRFTEPDCLINLREAQLVSIEPYTGPAANRYEPIPSGALVARVRIVNGERVDFIGDRSNLAVLGVLCRWPSPSATAP